MGEREMEDEPEDADLCEKGLGAGQVAEVDGDGEELEEGARGGGPARADASRMDKVRSAVKG